MSLLVSGVSTVPLINAVGVAVLILSILSERPAISGFPAQCVDASANSTALGNLGTCSSALAVASANCSVSMTSLEPALTAVALGFVCPRICGWCTNVFSFAVDPTELNRPFCSTRTPAKCEGPLNGNCSGVDLLSAPHPWHANASCNSVPGCSYSPGIGLPAGCVLHPFTMTTAEMAFLSSAKPEIRNVILQHNLDGKAIGTLSVSDFVSFGVSYGEALAFFETRDLMFKQFLPGLRQFAATQANRVHSGMSLPALQLLSSVSFDIFSDYGIVQEPLELEISIIIDKVFAVSELDYTFDVQFQILMSWLDPSIFRTCAGEDPWSVSPVMCPEIWRPTIKFLNADPSEGDFIPGTAQLWAEPTSWSDQYGASGTGKATAFMMASYKGRFSAAMSFRTFPYDDQELPIALHLEHKPDNLLRTQMKIKPKCTLAAQLRDLKNQKGGKDTLSGWNVDSASATEFSYQTFDRDALYGGGGAFDMYQDELESLGINTDEYSKTSAAQFIIHINRKASYFVLNYVLIVILLTALSWSTFILDATMLEERAGVALTLLLAIGVFQLILNDTMPKTGYLTAMHVFILTSTFFVAMVVAESLLIYILHRHQATKEAVLKTMKARMHVTRDARSSIPEGNTSEQYPESADSEQIVPIGAHGLNHNSCYKNVDRLKLWVIDYLDRFSLIAFPVSYAIVTALIFQSE